MPENFRDGSVGPLGVRWSVWGPVSHGHLMGLIRDRQTAQGGCEDSTRGILAWKRCEDPNKLGGQKPCSFFLWNQKISREKKRKLWGNAVILFNEWSVDGFCFLAWKVCTNWNRGPLSRVKGWIHKVSLNPCLFVRKLHIKHNNHLPQNFWYTESTPPAFSHKWKISPKIPTFTTKKKSPKIELPHTRLEPGSCIFGHFFSAKKSC